MARLRLVKVNVDSKHSFYVQGQMSNTVLFILVPAFLPVGVYTLQTLGATCVRPCLISREINIICMYLLQ